MDFRMLDGKWLYFGGQDETTNVYSTRYKDWKEWELATATNDITIDLNDVPVDLSGNPIFSIPNSNYRNLFITLNNAEPLTQLSSLSNLPNLTTLKIYSAKNSDLTGLSGLTNLTTLTIGYAKSLTDLTGLSNPAYADNTEKLHFTGLSNLPDYPRNSLCGLTDQQGFLITKPMLIVSSSLTDL